MVSKVPSSCSSFRGSKGVFPSSPNNLSNFVAASTNYSISITILTTHNFQIYGLNLAKNLFFYLAFCILPLWNSLWKHSKYFWTLSLGFCLMASSFILMSLTSTSPYFCTIWVLNSAQLVGVGYNLLNHSLAIPFKFSFTILKSLSAFRSCILATILSLSSQSLMSSWSRPQNSSSIP
jgi:hypothetical protein